MLLRLATYIPAIAAGVGLLAAIGVNAVPPDLVGWAWVAAIACLAVGLAGLALETRPLVRVASRTVDVAGELVDVHLYVEVRLIRRADRLKDALLEFGPQLIAAAAEALDLPPHAVMASVWSYRPPRKLMRRRMQLVKVGSLISSGALMVAAGPSSDDPLSLSDLAGDHVMYTKHTKRRGASLGDVAFPLRNAKREPLGFVSVQLFVHRSDDDIMKMFWSVHPVVTVMQQRVASG